MDEASLCSSSSLEISKKKREKHDNAQLLTTRSKIVSWAVANTCALKRCVMLCNGCKNKMCNGRKDMSKRTIMKTAIALEKHCLFGLADGNQSYDNLTGDQTYDLLV